MSNRHCWKTEKEVEALSVYIDAGRLLGLRRRKGGGGIEVAELGTDQTGGPGRQLPRPNHPQPFALI
jgi:hypothetical protein